MSHRHIFKRFRRDQSGATATEYAFLVGLIALVCATAWDGIGATVRKVFEAVSAALV